MQSRTSCGSGYVPSISGCLSHECKTGNQTDQSISPYPMTSAILIGRFHFLVLRSWTSNLKSTVCRSWNESYPNVYIR